MAERRKPADEALPEQPAVLGHLVELTVLDGHGVALLRSFGRG